MGFRYDSSGQRDPGLAEEEGRAVGPAAADSPHAGAPFETLSMDYNFLANQSGTADGAASQHASLRRQMRDGLMKGFDRAYNGNRAPLIIGNHFEYWNGGMYMDAVEDVMKSVCGKREVRCVSFRQLADWLDAQDPEMLARLRQLGVGERPKGGWSEIVGQKPTRLLSR